MARFLIYEDVRDNRKYVVEAADYETALATWEEAQDDTWMEQSSSATWQ